MVNNVKYAEEMHVYRVCNIMCLVRPWESKYLPKINNVVELCGEFCVVLCLLAVSSQESEWGFLFLTCKRIIVHLVGAFIFS